MSHFLSIKKENLNNLIGKIKSKLGLTNEITLQDTIDLVDNAKVIKNVEVTLRSTYTYWGPTSYPGVMVKYYSMVDGELELKTAQVRTGYTTTTTNVLGIQQQRPVTNTKKVSIAKYTPIVTYLADSNYSQMKTVGLTATGANEITVNPGTSSNNYTHVYYLAD